MTQGCRLFLMSLAVAGLVMAGCADQETPVSPARDDESGAALARSSTGGGGRSLAEMIDAANARLAAGGTDVRIDEAWLFSVGQGTDPYRRLRTGSKWVQGEVSYVLQESDYTRQLPAAQVEAALVSAYDRWNDVENTYIHVSRTSTGERNPDFLDGTFSRRGECVDILDYKSPALLAATDEGLFIDPVADIVVGGWLPAEYFESCLGSSSIIAVTWTLSSGDSNGDNYPDRVYVEQFYNERWKWVVSGAQFLNTDAGVDIETIAVHENGHAHGLGHFGGPNENEPFKLQPNGTVFDPEAVMNPFYLGGEKRDLFSTDIAALTTLYN